MAESEVTQSWSFVQIIVFVFQFIKKLIVRSKNAAGQVVIQVKIQFVQNASINQGRHQENQGRNQSHHNQRRLSISQVQMFAQILCPVLLILLSICHILDLFIVTPPIIIFFIQFSAAVSSEKSVGSVVTTHSLISKLAAVKAYHGYLSFPSWPPQLRTHQLSMFKQAS